MKNLTSCSMFTVLLKVLLRFQYFNLIIITINGKVTRSDKSFNLRYIHQYPKKRYSHKKKIAVTVTINFFQTLYHFIVIK